MKKLALLSLALISGTILPAAQASQSVIDKAHDAFMEFGPNADTQIAQKLYHLIVYENLNPNAGYDTRTSLVVEAGKRYLPQTFRLLIDAGADFGTNALGGLFNHMIEQHQLPQYKELERISSSAYAERVYRIKTSPQLIDQALSALMLKELIAIIKDYYGAHLPNPSASSATIEEIE